MDRRRFLAASGLLVSQTRLGEAFGQSARMPTAPSVRGTYRPLGTQTLADFLRGVRSQLPEGLASANDRLRPATGILAYCGATVWRDRYSLGIAGGHGDSYDDGHYALNLATGSWEMLLGPSPVASIRAEVDTFGEWIPNRPASQHSYNHLVTVGDDLVQGYGYAIGMAARASVQAHRWTANAMSWQRYGTGGTLRPVPHTVLHDPVRRQIVRFAHESGRSFDVIKDDDPEAAWTTIPIAWPRISIYASIGYHADLDCFVLIDERIAPGQAWVMEGNAAGFGWQRLEVSGTPPSGTANSGLEYVPPMRCLAAAYQPEPDTLYFLAPTSGPRDPWVWIKEKFVGSVPVVRWEVNGLPVAPFGRVKWSARLEGLVILKAATSYAELFTPAAILRR